MVTFRSNIALALMSISPLSLMTYSRGKVIEITGKKYINDCDSLTVVRFMSS